MSARIVTVDGSSGSGKTTLGRRLAIELGLPLLDTGLVYRGVMVAAVRRGLGTADREQLTELAREARIEVNTDPDENAAWHVRVDGSDAGTLLRAPEHAILLSTLSQIPEVRHLLLPLQRRLGEAGAVAVGRDCGTVVFPDAAVKLFLEAPARLRVQRREQQLRDAGISADAAAVSDDVSGRDRLDAPSMVPAPGAHVIDTGAMDADAAFAEALRLCREAGIAGSLNHGG